MTRGHAEHVRAYAHLIGQEIGLDEDDLAKLGWAALVHDVGKLEVPAALLNKAGRPTAEEWDVIRLHPAAAARHIEGLRPWLGGWVDAATQHHERLDGDGYPAGLRGPEISLGGRVVAIADAYDVMTSARSYKKPLPVAAARAELAHNAGTQFDPALVRAFLSVSLGRMRVVLGPLGWLTQLPQLLQAPVAVASLRRGRRDRVGRRRPSRRAHRDAGERQHRTRRRPGRRAARRHLRIGRGAGPRRIDRTRHGHGRPGRRAACGPDIDAHRPADQHPGRGRRPVDPSVTDVGGDHDDPASVAGPERRSGWRHRHRATGSGDDHAGPDRSDDGADHGSEWHQRHEAPTAPATTGPTTTATTGTTTTPTGGTVPVAVPDLAVVPAGQLLNIHVLANDVFPAGGPDVTTLRITVAPAHASSIVPAGQNVKYTADAAYVGVDAFEYEICDVAASCARAVVTVTVTP